ncbi:hypothetical protein JYK14_04785 [Siccirubricoccus sp. KC 17139]|uniref:Uncharacterized protein n=1 Tax=Siccirubricoccus soli TaxID=2899147 RepID=A0ABT1D0P7_9PROT|nr:hypothetical protein [Siccirubricoccus soli]MCO6415493.1 hypothetical protein [Siccirubricoccus soli]MCP2681625.1 hypothetical protein [Siccirubricoccus soli]
MAWAMDARIPVALVADPAGLGAALAGGKVALLASAPCPGDGALAVESFAPEASHSLACACCQGRSPAAVALDRLFQARVRGRVGWFERVVAWVPDEPSQAAVRAALALDALTAARFRAG